MKPNHRGQRGYQLIEALVYLALLFALLGVGYAALYRCIDYSVLLRRDSDDIIRALKAGERWRADVRAAQGLIRLESDSNQEILRLSQNGKDICYSVKDGALFRRAGTGPWISVLSRVKSSVMQPDRQFNIPAWRWELELLPEAKGAIKPGRIRPLFTFIAVPQSLRSP